MNSVEGTDQNESEDEAALDDGWLGLVGVVVRLLPGRGHSVFKASQHTQEDVAQGANDGPNKQWDTEKKK